MLDRPEDLNSLSDEAFRERFLAWLRESYPPEWRRPIVLRLRGPREQQWLRMLYEGGYRCPGWPREYGGMGLSIRKQIIYHEVLDDFGAARVLDAGATMLGPALIKYGTPEQRERHLSGILKGEILWCQGYSEPNSGSDLASLTTSAVLEDDTFILNGTKIWTTMAGDSHMMFLLARTDRAGAKQAGISFLLMDMTSPGVTVRPICNLVGEDEFAQVFFEEVRIPAENLVHQINTGWTVAKSLLGDERIFVGRPALSRQAFAILLRLVDTLVDKLDDAEMSSLAALYCDLHDLEALYGEVTEAAVHGDSDPNSFGMMKVLASEMFKRVSDQILAIAGEHAATVGDTLLGSESTDLRRVFMIARPTSIYGGTNEVQKNIIARSILGPETR